MYFYIVMRNDILPVPDIDWMLSSLQSLVECNTSFPPGNNYPEFARILINLCQELEASHESISVPEVLFSSEGVYGERINLLTTPDMGHSELPEVLIYFHVDTAPEGHGWSRPAFSLTVEDDCVYGRGTADMKGAIVAVLDALRRLRQGNVPLAFKPVLAFCTDEEGGRFPGIRYLAENRQLPDTLLNLNGSAENRIWAGCFGSLTYELVCEGCSVHSGTPELGVNALESAMPAIQALMQLKQHVELRESEMPARPWSSGPLRARLTLTAIRAGDKGSSVPGQCRITINRRYLPEEDEKQVHAEIHQGLSEALAGSDLVNWSLDEVGHLPPVREPDGPATERWTVARAAAADLPTSAFTRYGSSTSSDFGWVQRAGIQHMLLGGLSRPECNVHGPDEHTFKSDLVRLSRSIENFLSASFHTSEAAATATLDTQF